MWLMVHSGKRSFTITALKLWRCLCFFGLLLSIDLRPSHVTVKGLSAEANMMGDINLILGENMSG